MLLSQITSQGKFRLAAAAALVLTAVALTPTLSHAQAPAGSTGQCNDGTYTTAAKKSGACGGHKGVKTWTGPAATPAAPAKGAKPPVTTQAAAPTKPASTPAPAAAPAKPAATPAAAPAPAPKASAASSASKTPKTVAPGGGPGMVWVNTSTKVYHCYGGEDYGTTKEGKYMSESAATAMGARASHGKACSK